MCRPRGFKMDGFFIGHISVWKEFVEEIQIWIHLSLRKRPRQDLLRVACQSHFCYGGVPLPPSHAERTFVQGVEEYNVVDVVLPG